MLHYVRLQLHCVSFEIHYFQCIIFIIIFTEAVKAQQRIRCYATADCDINQLSEAIVSDDYVSICCNYPSAGVKPRGFSYQLQGQEACKACPKSMFSIDTTCSNYLLEMLSICYVTRSSLSQFI